MGMNLLCLLIWLTQFSLSLCSLYLWYAAGVDVSAAIEFLQGIQNETAAVQSSSPSHEDDVDNDDLDFVVSNDHESVLEEAFVCADGNGVAKDATHTPEEVYDDLQYPYG